MKKNITEGSAKDVAAEPTVDTGNAYLPDTDILEDDEGLTMILDLPGVELGGVEVEVDENAIFTLKAKNSFKEPDGGGGREFAVGDYHRVFQLGEEFDRDKLSAILKNGVLTVTIPRKENAKPRRIVIKT